MLVALEAEFVARGPTGERSIAAADFFTGVFETALGPGELLAEIRVPRRVNGTYLKLSRRAQDWATVGVAAVRDDAGVRVALANMGPTPVRARGVEQALAAGVDARAAAESAAEGADQPSNHTATSDYRSHLARVLVRRALEIVGT